MTWTYTGFDPAQMLFAAAVERFGMTFAPHSRILDLGCNESDFLRRLSEQDPTLDLVGVDYRPSDTDLPGVNIRQGSAMDSHLFEHEVPFDWILMLGALEHFGLSFYSDPLDDAGDIKTLQNCAQWLKSGACLYFDVPLQPQFRIATNRHFRMYSPKNITEMLAAAGLREIARGYSLPEPQAGTWVEEPTVSRDPYWFVAVLAEKA